MVEAIDMVIYSCIRVLTLNSDLCDYMHLTCHFMAVINVNPTSRTSTMM